MTGGSACRALRLSWRVALCAGVAAGVYACSVQESTPHTDTLAVAGGPARVAGRPWSAETWQPPVVDSTPDDPLETAIYRGLALVTHTHDSLPAYATSALNCTSCHLDEGRRANAAPMVASYVHYPRLIERTGAVVTIEDRVNYCFTRSLSGAKLPPDSREMADIVAYLSYISKGVPAGEHVRGESMPKMPALAGDSAHGAPLFADNCARCHGAQGAGMGVIPPLWGPASFSIGASMARLERAASFIRYNMPFDRPGTLTDQQAFDLAAYMTSMPRPDLPGKENDWPNGGAPADVPYATRGHAAFHPPRLLPRVASAGASTVAAPISVLRAR